MPVATRAALAIVIAAYPFVIFFGLKHLEPIYLGVFISLLFIVRFIVAKRTLNTSTVIGLTPLLASGLGCSALTIFLNDSSYLKLIPSLINLLLLLSFGYTLFSPPSVIERLARISEPDLPQSAINYTRKVTMVWCVFFIANGAIALYTALFSSVATWTFYNGFIAYLLIAALFAVEYIVRTVVRQRTTE